MLHTLFILHTSPLKIHATDLNNKTCFCCLLLCRRASVQLDWKLILEGKPQT